MNDQRRKSLDEFSNESEQFERQFEQFQAGEGNESARADLIAKIVIWLQDCATQGRFIPSASPHRRAFRSLLGSWNSRLRAQGHFIEGIDNLADFDSDAGIVLRVDCPYPGLEPYTQSQRDSFFGREELVTSSVQHLEQQGNRILAIIGASGSGKSSVALAGILPRLMELHEGAWIFGKLTPGVRPLAEFAALVAQVIGLPDQATEIERGLTDKPGEALGRLAERCRGKTLMLLIDQFEELFTMCRDAGERSAFAQVLCSLSDPAVSINGFSCRILLTLRTDHLKHLEDHDPLKELHRRLVGEKNILWLSYIGFDDIKRAIKKPADEVGLRFVPEGLVDQLASQTAGPFNGLPLLQFSLRRLWDTRPKNQAGEPLDLVTRKMVEDLPDVAGALGKVADSIFATFTRSQKKLCERLLLELLVLDENFEAPLRRRRNEEELKGVLPKVLSSPPDPGEVDRVIEDLVRAGLLRRFGDGANAQLEVAHEALLRHWPQIYQLVTGAETKERLHLIKQIGRQAGDWTNHGKSRNYLILRGEQLNHARKYAADGWLAEAEAMAYVAACRSQQVKRTWYFLVKIFFVLGLSIFAYLYRQDENRRIAEMEKTQLDRIAKASELVSYGFYYLLQTDDSENARKNFEEANQVMQEQGIVAKLGLGLIFMKNLNYEEARSCFEEVISLTLKRENRKSSKQDPLLYTYYYYLGKSCNALNKHADAIDAFESAKALMEKRNPGDKNLPDYLYQLGLSHLYLGETEDAEKFFNEASRLGWNKKATIWDAFGQIYLRNRDFHAAKAAFEEAIKIDPNECSFYVNLGHANLELGEFNDAKRNFETALVKGAGAAAHNALGQLYVKKREFKRAITEFEKAINLDPNEPAYHISLGLAYFANQDWEGSIKVFTNVVEKDPKNASAWLNLTQAYVSEANRLKERNENKKAGESSKKAEDAINKALRNCELKGEDRQKALTLLADSLVAQGNYQAAIAAYEELCKNKPQDAFLALYLADAYYENKKRPKAEEYVKKAEDLANSDPQLQVQEAKNFFDQKIRQLKDNINGL